MIKYFIAALVLLAGCDNASSQTLGDGPEKDCLNEYIHAQGVNDDTLWEITLANCKVHARTLVFPVPATNTDYMTDLRARLLARYLIKKIINATNPDENRLLHLRECKFPKIADIIYTGICVDGTVYRYSYTTKKFEISAYY